ncbi:hypothetical protein ANN_00058 [Periplaneta americana]|uniref:Gustatory receptor n=1 Tax=Periplaneta americana TaxID=6978 RepID=A0ABQ8TS39_PERAM|nr:hypothetical protein ANN_00058 [Periplaneta americana]
MGPGDIYAATKSLYYLSKIFGLAPFQYSSPTSDKKIRVGLLWTVTVNFAPNFIIADILSKLLLYGTCEASLISAATINTINLPGIIRKFSRIDKQLFSITSADYRKIRKWLIFEIVTLTLIMVPFYCFHVNVYGIGMNLYFVLIDEVAHLVILVTDLQFVNIVQFLKRRCKQMNSNLKQIMNYPERNHAKEHYNNETSNAQETREKYTAFLVTKHISVLPIHKTSHTVTEIRVLRETCSDLHDTAIIINRSFGLFLLLEVTCIFISLVSTLYNLLYYMSVTMETDGNAAAKVICHLFWIAFYLCKGAAITWTCQSAAYEVSKSAALIQRLLLDRFLANDIVSELQAFFVQLGVHTITFTACGFFTMNLSLLHGIIAATATYIIILLQFS